MSNLPKDIGNVVISLTMASFAFMLVSLEMRERAVLGKIERLKRLGQVDAITEEKLQLCLKHIEVIRWICASAAGCSFVVGACLVIIGLISGCD